MYKDKDMGAYVFYGGEDELAKEWMWACIYEMSLLHRLKFAYWIVFLKKDELGKGE